MEEEWKDITNFEGLYQCCRGKYKSMYKYKWKYKQ